MSTFKQDWEQVKRKHLTPPQTICELPSYSFDPPSINEPFVFPTERTIAFRTSWVVRELGKHMLLGLVWGAIWASIYWAATVYR